jgi:hypothetical protein
MKKYLVAILFFIVILPACTVVTLNTKMESWVGKPIDDVSASWGAPDSSISRSDGGTTYTWTTINSDDRDAKSCQKTIVTDSKDIVVSWSISDGCGSLNVFIS